MAHPSLRDGDSNFVRLVDGAGAPLRVLVVEDEAITAMDYSRIMEDAGARVLGAASSAPEAEELAKILKPDVIIMDVKLHGQRDGVDAATAISAFSDACIVFVTGNTGPDTSERIRAFNGTRPVCKPADPDALVAAVAESVAG